MSKAALSEFVRFAKYARHNDSAGRRETWKEQVARMMNMHRTRYAYEIEQSTELSSIIDYVEKMIYDKKVLGSQRALQYGGKPILKKNARLYNCSATYADRYTFFQHLVYLTMCGCGVGFSVQFRHANNMPKFRRRNEEEVSFVVPDTMEGWADAIGVLMSSYAANTEKAPFPDFVGKKVIFDYSKVRPEGSKISSGGKCPGPQPLRSCIENCERTLDSYFDIDEEVKLKPIQIYDLAMYIAGAVVSGGIRRSATICMFSLEDEEMMHAKTGNWFEKSPHWQNSNNSVVLVRGRVDKKEFDDIFKATKQFGEPGFIWVDNEDVLFNPCITTDTEIDTTEGKKTAFELIGKKFTAIVDGKEYESTKDGFWITGIKPTLKITSCTGRKLRLTATHEIKISGVNSDSIWVKAEDLNIGNFIRISSEEEKYEELISIEEGPEEVVCDCTIPGINAFSANGFYVHNCSEIGMAGYLSNGNLKDGMPWEGDDYAMGKVESGVEFCNLSEINGAKAKTEEEFYEACKAASIIGTLQAGYTDIGYISDVSIDIIKKEALIGVSITGIMEYPEILLNPEIQKNGAKIVKEWNEKVASLIGINKAARCTCIKPSGTASSLLETSAGIHPHHSRRYLRRVRANRNETALKFYKSKNPASIEPDFTDPNGVTEVITFICETNKHANTKMNTSAMDLLKAVHITQKNWVEEGTREDSSILKSLRHNVSNTIHVSNNEWDGVRDYLYDNRESFAGVSMISVSGDKDYNQAPYASVMYPNELVDKFGPGAIMASGLIVDGMKAWQNDLWAACDALIGIKSIEYKISTNDAIHYYILGDRHAWVLKANNFAKRYFDSDINKMISCLKEVQCLFIWEKIQRNYTDVDWSECKEGIDTTKIQQDVACSGGACEVTSI